MEQNDLKIDKKKLMLDFFKDNFNINLEEYDDKKIRTIIKVINSEIDKIIKEETKKSMILFEIMEKQKLEIDKLSGNL